MKILEWGALDSDRLTPHYQREEARWLSALGWDTSSSWATIETARRGWGLPGYACCDESGAIAGWTFFMRRADQIEIGGLVSDSPEATGLLLDAVLEHGADAVSGFLYAAAPGVHEACAARGIDTERFTYLVRTTHRVPFERPHARLRPWRSQDIDSSASLLRQAYGDAGSLFAPDNSVKEWRAYVDNLVAYSGCGVLQPQLSRVIEADGQIAALALVTSLASDTAHLAQLAVSPSLRRSGLGRLLLADTLRSAHACGYRQMSLMVSTENVAANRLYARWEFCPRGEFLALRGRRDLTPSSPGARGAWVLSDRH